MRRFVMRKLALFDWIHQLCKEDQVIAYRIYTIIDNIRLYTKIPFLLALIFVGVPFLFPLPDLIQAHSSTTIIHATFQCFLACVFYAIGVLLFSLFIFRPLCRECIRELQHMFFQPNASRVLNLLINLDHELLEQTQALLRPKYLQSHRRTRRLHP